MDRLPGLPSLPSLPGIGNGGGSNCPLRNTKQAMQNLLQGVQSDLKNLASNARGLTEKQIQGLTDNLRRFVEIVQNALSQGPVATVQSLSSELLRILGSVANTVQDLVKAGIPPTNVLPG